MKKSILKLGKNLNKTEQQKINGGGHPNTEASCLACGGHWHTWGGSGKCLLLWSSDCL